MNTEKQLDAPLRETPVDNAVRLSPPKTKRAFSPAGLFADHAFAARMWMFVACGALVLVAVQPYLIIEAYRARERVVILDGGGSFSVSPLLGFEEAKTLHETLSIWSALALLQRNPKNFDFPDLLQRLFLTDAATKAQNELLASREEFEVKQIHQKPEVFKIDILRTREDQVLVRIEGQLVRTGVFERQAFTESPRFALTLTLVRNPDMIANKRYPLAVWNYEFSLL
ncbi:hypothetical protein M2447_002201 [Ereboglobus sp. PH5-10]|uniref:Bacterial virulence protein VirB8 domain-containing protein n=1 Tax=Ereboglobus luteus TaxID=1796921 RepID=A0A2U8E3Z5_9BACT|nr:MULTISPECIES: hypothetical protein [Ereboglobus]AWI09637.1 hypothetical protein CKA38_10605 [Ereboglobus luteus]MDF9828088.1 hypothetical protein [Ereboglobus sp. PH5-10]